MLDLGDVLELVIDGFDDGTFAVLEDVVVAQHMVGPNVKTTNCHVLARVYPLT